MMEDIAINSGNEAECDEAGDTFVDAKSPASSGTIGDWRPLSPRDVTNPTSPSHRRSPLSRTGSLTRCEYDRLVTLEHEQEELNASLLALTTHFAQVQFRLQQIGQQSSTDDKERLLAELETFAFRGCPDVLSVCPGRQNPARIDRKMSGTTRSTADNGPDLMGNEDDGGEMSESQHSEFVEAQRIKQLQLIGQLRDQLEDLEQFAYEMGESGPPSTVVMEKQRVIIEQLRDRIELDLDGFDRMPPEDLQKAVDQAVKRVIRPMKAKDQLVSQLQTQIQDLERFVEFLQVENGTCTCDKDKLTCAVHNRPAGQQVSDAKALGFNQRSSRAGDMRMFSLSSSSHCCSSTAIRFVQLTPPPSNASAVPSRLRLATQSAWVVS